MAGNDCAWSSQYIVALAQNKYTNSVGILALVPLALQFFTGLYLFVLPYATKWRGAATIRGVIDWNRFRFMSRMKCWMISGHGCAIQDGQIRYPA